MIMIVFMLFGRTLTADEDHEHELLAGCAAIDSAAPTLYIIAA